MSYVLRLHDFLAGRERILAYLIAVLVVVITWAVILNAGNTVRSMDEPDFLAIARNLAYHGLFATEPGFPTAYRAPGLAFFLTPFVALGADLMELRLVNAVLLGLTLVLLFHLVRRHASPMAALLAVAMVPVWPVVIYAATTIYPQTLAAFLLVLLVFLMDRMRDGPHLLPAVASGLAYGALVLTVPIVLLLLPVLLAWLLYISRRRFSHALIFCAVSGALVSGWTMRNYLVFDAFVPVATSSGYNLIYGNAPNARYNTSLEIRLPEYLYTELTGRDEIDRNEIMTRAAFAEIRRDPERFLRLYLSKFVHWFDYSNRLLSDQVIDTGASSIPVWIREILLFTTYLAVIGGPLLVHLILARRVPFRSIDYFFLALWIAAGLAYALFFTRVRFRLPFDWFVIASNAMFLAALLESVVRQRRMGGGEAPVT